MSVTTDTDIGNKALRHLAVLKKIGSIKENSAEAIACDTFIDDVREMVLRDFDWPFATKYAAAQLVTVDPVSEWKYAYLYPSDCVRLRKILSGNRVDDLETEIKFIIVNGDTSQLIYTDQEDAQFKYTELISDGAKYPPDFKLAFSLLLASFAAPTVTNGDKSKLGDAALKKYLLMVAQAKQNAAFEEAMSLEFVDTESVQARL